MRCQSGKLHEYQCCESLQIPVDNTTVSRVCVCVCVGWRGWGVSVVPDDKVKPDAEIERLNSASAAGNLL